MTGRPFESGEQAIRKSLAEQITQPIRWVECIRYMRNAGVLAFVELGDSKVLTSLIDKITAEEHYADGERQDLVARIRREILQPEVGDVALQFDEKQSFRQLGLDSIVYVRLARRVEAVFGIPFKPDVMYANRTCAALAEYLLAQQVASKAEVKNAVPWREYRDERVLALLRDCANGTLGVDKVIEEIRAGGAHHQ